MSPRTHVDPVAGRAFFRGGPIFVCMLVPPVPGEPRRSALMAFAFAADRFDAALDFARHAGGRHPAMVVERIATGTDAWPGSEPLPAREYVVERGGVVVLAPSVEAWVTMPPAQPHHLVQLVAALGGDDVAAAHSTLEALGCCGLVARVRAVLHGDSGAQIDAVTCTADGLRAGWFVAPARAADVTPVVATPLPEPRAAPVVWRDRDALLNAALAIYLAPSANPSRLEAWLRDNAPDADAGDVRATLDALLASADQVLWNETPAVTWNDAFAARLLDQVRARHPWLAASPHPPLIAYAQWLCWHEGLGGA